MIHQRLLALAFAFVVAGAPEALEACQLFCASHTHNEMQAIPHMDDGLPTAGQ